MLWRGNNLSLLSGQQVETLECDGTGKVTVIGATQLQVQNFQDPLQGSRCSFHVGPNSVLMHPGKDLYVSGEAPTLDLEGRVESGTLRIGKSGKFLMKSKNFTVKAIQLEDQAVLNVLVSEDGDSQSVNFSNLTLGYGVVLNFTQPNVTLTADSLEMLPASVVKVSAETARLHVIADSVTIHDNAEISVTGQGLGDLSAASAGEMCVGVGGCACVRSCA